MIKDRAVIRVRELVEMSYAVSDLDSLVTAVKSLSRVGTTGLLDKTKEAFDWEARLRARDSSAFVHVLGSHVSTVDFATAVTWLASPAHYVNTAGFSLWAPKAMLIYSAITLKGHHVFWS